MKKIVGIDASRNRSGGAVAHMVGILSASNPETFGIKHVHLWAYKSLMDKIPNFPWLTKHTPSVLEKSILHQLLWQYFYLPREVQQSNCEVLFNTDAGSICPFTPCITMSQDLLSFETEELKRYGFSKEGLRILLLRFLQSRSLARAEIAVFLTHYAKNTIQHALGPLKSKIIAHGVSSEFRQQILTRHHSLDQKRTIRCIYVSNVAFYKHQWHVAAGIEKVRRAGFDISLLLVGGGSGRPKKMLEKQLRVVDPDASFIHQMDFVEHQNIPKLLAISDIFIFASSCESLPITLLEAMAFGLPIACSQRGPMLEVLEDGGVYFDPENPDSIAESVKNIILNSALREKIAERAMQISEKYTWEKCAAETWTTLAECQRD